MRVIFTQDVRGRGKRGEVKEVADGYAQNYLIKNGKAKKATPAAMRELQAQQAAQQREKDEEYASAEMIKNFLEKDETVVELHSKAGSDGRLFGSIPSKQIAQALNQQFKIDLDKRKIVLPEPIKTLGYTNVPVKLYPGIEAKIRVHVSEK
ncbi:50S ribosomal protein L9 [Bombilactobacillus bombi]|uniref:50S ribosomal protein L9 n=1 Tax=Bombilactobacillus bombi TaxID=1303590 RepID=UPI0015E5F01E|nr:50S ribosomal protein L9 [Bombilactobacillus bombi]MBA1433756.1 50S ribosomal protein L9 [Bombilactobacillus bombi]